jgi:hypothetical protein
METPSHDGRFHQFSRPHTQSRDCPKRSDGAEHESGSKHEHKIEHASLESFLHGRTSQRQSTTNSFTANRVPNIALFAPRKTTPPSVVPGQPVGQVNDEVGCPVLGEASGPTRQRTTASVRGEHRAFAGNQCRQYERPTEVPREGRNWQRQNRASQHGPYGSMQELDRREKATGTTNPSVRERHHGILAKGQNRLALRVRISSGVQCRHGEPGNCDATLRVRTSGSAYGSNPSALVVNSTKASRPS